MIIVSITGPTMREALAQIARSARYADAFEFRLDLIRNFSVPVLLVAGTKPTVFTYRPRWEGGAFDGNEMERLEILKYALRLGASFIDIELNSGKHTIEQFTRYPGAKSRLIVSHHVFMTRPVVNSVYRALNRTGAGIVKLAFDAHDACDLNLAVRFLSLAKKDRRKAIAIGMGECGEASRVLYKKWGGWATYASVETGDPAAPGQIRAAELQDVYHVNGIRSSTKVFGVIGNPVRQSKGVYVHNPLFRKAGIKAVYCRFPVVNLRRFMKEVAPMLHGFSITIPHKQGIMKYLDSVDPTAKSIGAVNTVVMRRGGMFGTNTDAPGALDAIERTARVKGKRILVLGAGGAARAIAYEAKQRGAQILLCNRTHGKVVVLARSLRGTPKKIGALRPGDFDIIVNATSVGMIPHINKSPLPIRLLKRKVVFDAVYNPPETLLLREARRVGSAIIKGTEMYIHQAARQSELYTGVRPSAATVRRLLSNTY